jgi:rRNA maturation endonuclease Nob1
MSVENKSVDIHSETDEAIKYCVECVECGAKMSKKLQICLACGESQI